MKLLDYALIVLVVFAAFLLFNEIKLFELYANTQSTLREELQKEGFTPNDPRKFSIYLTGEVKYPGIYQVTSSIYLYELIEIAGGFNEAFLKDTPVDNLNLAKLITGPEHIDIKSIAPTKHNSNQGIISINSASQTELMSLKGIGEATASKIIEHRPYSTLEDLMEVPGIGTATFSKLQNSISL